MIPVLLILMVARVSVVDAIVAAVLVVVALALEARVVPTSVQVCAQTILDMCGCHLGG